MSIEGNLKGVEREALVISDLSKKGFEVFKSLGATSCDLIALKNGACVRIEVKGIRPDRNSSGPIGSHGRGRGYSGGNPDCRDFDVLVRVRENGEMVYQRSVFHTVNAASQELPLREDYNPRTRKDIVERADTMENPKND